MESTTSTTTMPGATVASPSGFFKMNSFGDVKITQGNRVVIPAMLADDFANVVRYLAGKPNTTVMGPIPVADAKAADLLRKQVRQYAGDHALSASFRGLVKIDDDATDAGDVEVKTDDTGTPYNDDTHVTFRFATPKVKDASPVDTSTVTVTAGTPRAATPATRGQAILARN